MLGLGLVEVEEHEALEAVLEEGEPGGGAEISGTAGDDGVACDAEALEGGVGAGAATDGDFFRGGGLWTGVGG